MAIMLGTGMGQEEVYGVAEAVGFVQGTRTGRAADFSHPANAEIYLQVRWPNYFGDIFEVVTELEINAQHHSIALPTLGVLENLAQRIPDVLYRPSVRFKSQLLGAIKLSAFLDQIKRE